MDRFRSFAWQDQQDRSVAADFLERVAEDGGTVRLDRQDLWWVSGFAETLPEQYGVVLRHGEPRGTLQKPEQFRPPGTVQGTGDRLTLNPGESDVYLAAAFLLDRVEGVAFAQNGTVLLDSPYASGSTARARNFAEQFGLTVTLDDDPRLTPKWDLRRPRLGTIDVSPLVTATLDRYRTPWQSVQRATKTDIDTVIVNRAGVAKDFEKAGGTVIVMDTAYGLTPITAKKLLHAVYLGSARAV